MLNDTFSEDLNWLKLPVNEIQNFTNQFLISNGEESYNIWQDYVTMMFDGIPNVNLSLKDDDLIYIRQFELDYLGEILLFMKRTPFKIIELYMWWSTVHAMIINTTTDIIEFIYKQYAAIYADSDDEVIRPK